MTREERETFWSAFGAVLAVCAAIMAVAVGWALGIQWGGLWIIALGGVPTTLVLGAGAGLYSVARKR